MTLVCDVDACLTTHSRGNLNFYVMMGSPIFIVVVFSSTKMISSELRKLIMAQFRDGRSVPEIHILFKGSCSIRTLYNLAEEYAAGVEEKVKKTQRQPPKKVTSKMAARMNRLLTTGKTHQSFRSAAKLLEINESTVRYHAGKKWINFYKKRK